ncbi:LysR family transcriptional regulator [bacterium]|nr:LysR family transcriptional regulator [bacterium]
MDRELRVVLSARVFSDQKCFGPGVSQLLKRVDELHSLRAAALSMSMAYSKAWTILRAAEAGLGFKLLSSTAGGRHGGGAVLTDEARRMLRAYDDYCEKLRSYGEQLFEETFAFYDALPKAERGKENLHAR